MIKSFLSVAALTALSVVGISAATTPLQVNQSYSTGYVNGVASAPGTADAYFTLFTMPFTVSAPVVASPIPAVWVTTPGAQWISPTENQTYPAPPVEGDPAGTYDYNAILSTNFLVPTQVTVTGSFAADNGGTLFVDGTSVISVAPPAYGTLTPFDFTFTIFTGQRNTPIDFVVNNLDDTNGTVNPTGVIVSNLTFATNTTPEPSTWLLLFVGAGALLVVQRVRRASVL